MGLKTRSQVKNDVFNIPEEDRCSHIRQSVNVNHMKKGLKEFIKYGACQECEIAGTADETPGIYVCLLCGHQGCDRSTEGQHALKHFEACRSHSCAINVINFQVWCYKCDDFKSSQLKSVQDCMDTVAKLFKTVPGSTFNVAASTGEVVAQVTQPLTSISSADSAKYSKVKGLSNLGNTCFFNSVMQNINQSHLFELRLRGKKKKNTSLKLKAFIRESNDNDDDTDVSNQLEFGEVALDIQLDSCAGLTKSLLSFYESASPDSIKKEKSFSPSELFGWLCKKAPQFRGYQQQDSHELLRHLLDGIREEEIKRLQTGILKTFNVTSPNSVSDYKAEQIKAFGKSAKHTTVDEIFGGYLISVVTCKECSTPYEIYEPFLDLCLPVVDDMSTYSPEKSGRYSHEVASKKESNNEKIESKYMTKKMRKSAKKLKKQNKTNKVKPLLNASIGEGAAAADDDHDKEGKSKEEDDDDKEENKEEEDDDDDKENNKEDEDDDDDDKENSKKGDDDDDKEKNKEEDNDDDKENSKKGDDDDGTSLLVKRINLVELDKNEDLKISSSSKINGVGSVVYTDSEEGNAESEKNLNELHKKMCKKDDEEKPNEINSPISCNDIRSTDLDNNISVQDYSSIIDRDYFFQEDEIIEKKKRNIVKMAMSSLGQRENKDECSIYSCLHQFTTEEFLGSNNKYICDHCNSSKLKKSKESIYTAATKQALIFVPPAILTLQLKRFQQSGKSLKKISKHVSFTELLDLAPFCSRFTQNVETDKRKVLYSLFGIVEHSGGMGGGHYVAYVKVRDEVKDAEKFIQKLLPHQVSTDRLIECMQSLSGQHKDVKDSEAVCHRSNCVENVQVPCGKWYYASDGHVSEVKDVTNILQCQAYLLFYERIL